MAKDPAFLFYPGDYLRDTQNLNEAQQVAYDRMMCEHMRNICISKSQLNFFTKRLTSDERKELLHFFVEVDGGFQIEWVAESIVKRRSYSQSRRDNRKKNMNNICETYDEHMVIENETVNGSINISFDIFWNAYDKKKGDKEKLIKKWNLLTDSDRMAIMEYIPKYKESQPDKQYRKDPQTFLNNKSWNDELIYKNGKPPERKSITLN